MDSSNFVIGFRRIESLNNDNLNIKSTFNTINIVVDESEKILIGKKKKPADDNIYQNFCFSILNDCIIY